MGLTRWRALVLLLLLGNLLFFAWARGWLNGIPGLAHDGEREPERLRRQLRADAVTVASAPAPASAALVPRAADAASGIAASAVASAAPAPASAPAVTVCLQAGPFAEFEMGPVAQALDAAGVPDDGWQALPQKDSPSWWIYMGRYPDAETLNRKIEELKRINVRPQPVRSPAPMRPGLLLARFDDDTAAEAELGRLASRGVRTARVVSVTGEPALQAVRVASAGTDVAAALRALKLGDHARTFLPCPAADAAPAAAPAASVGAASAAQAASAAIAPRAVPPAGSAASGPTAASAAPIARAPARTPSATAAAPRASAPAPGAASAPAAAVSPPDAPPPSAGASEAR